MSSATQPSKPPKISKGSFQVNANDLLVRPVVVTVLQISIGVLLGLAVIVAGARIAARYFQSHRLAVHDGFYTLALITFIAGTIILYFDIPYIYLQEDVEAGLQMPPSNFIAQLIHSVKLQYPAATLLGTAIISVKFSFLFFFRALIRQQKKMEIWWWCIFGVLIPTAPMVMFSSLMSCPYTDKRILGKSMQAA